MYFFKKLLTKSPGGSAIGFYYYYHVFGRKKMDTCFFVLELMKKVNCVKKIALRFTYSTYLVVVPEIIFQDIYKIRQKFDKWLYDKSNNHGNWVIINGKKMAVSFDAETFVDYINDFCLIDGYEKVRITDRNATNIPEGIPILSF